MRNFHIEEDDVITEQVQDYEFNTKEYIRGLFELAETQGLYQDLGKEIGKLVDKKQMAYGNSVGNSIDILKIFLRKYKNEDNTYTIPESLLWHLLLQVRIIDKQNRIFNNPDLDLMEENVYSDLCGYSLLGHHYVEKVSGANE